MFCEGMVRTAPKELKEVEKAMDRTIVEGLEVDFRVEPWLRDRDCVRRE